LDVVELDPKGWRAPQVGDCWRVLAHAFSFVLSFARQKKGHEKCIGIEIKEVFARLLPLHFEDVFSELPLSVT
jgi:hypothetical protein